MSKQLENRSAIVTGAAQGIGLHIAEELLSNGARVLVNDLTEQILDAARKKLGNGDNIDYLAGDVSKKEVVDAIVNRAVEVFGSLDMVVANAGLTISGPFLDFKEAELRQMLDLNLVGSFLLAQAGARQMISQNRGGRILFLSSVTGIQAIKGTEGYGMTKAALRMLAKTLGVELGPRGITVNCIAPGATETERTLQNPDYSREWGKLIPTRRLSNTFDIAKASLYLLGPHAEQVTGQTLVIDGGWTATGVLPEQI